MLKFIERLLKRETRPPMALPDRRVFAVGDIHGCDVLLAPLIEAMVEETADDAVAPLFIFLGDYVDRGPASSGVIERLIGLRDKGHNARFLCGNHEESMLRFMSDLEAGLSWPNYGGKATLTAYGVEPPADETSLEGWRQSQLGLKAAIPPSHMRFLWSLEDRIELGDYLFVHAGVRPGRPLNEQKVRDLRWIREPFLSDPAPLDKVVVHGHTPAEEPHADARRIGVDTWAYRTGVLTAVELSEGEPRFLQARQDAHGVNVAWQARQDERVGQLTP